MKALVLNSFFILWFVVVLLKEVIVYSTQTCPYCHFAKDFLASHKIKFKDIDINKDQKAAQEMVKKSGQSGVPVLDIGGKIIIGFDREAIMDALGIKE